MKKGITCGVSLHEDLVMEIFSRLPVKTLLRFRCVSKSCCNMITSPQFVKLHLSRSLDRNSGVILLHWYSFLSSFDLHHPQLPAVQLRYPNPKKLLQARNKTTNLDNLFEDIDDNDCDALPVDIKGISNGVVCFDRLFKFILYNPATRSSIQIPQVTLGCGLYMSHNEFGYDCIGDDYKILSVIRLLDEPNCSRETFIYSLKSSSWQKIENPPWTVLDVGTRGVVANNSIYWVLNDKEISSFDLWSQTYGNISTPMEVNSFSGNLSLGVLKGRLHAIKIGIGIGIWMLNEDHQWTLLFRCLDLEPPRYSLWPLPFAYSKDGSKILVGVDEEPVAFLCCDLNSQTITTSVTVLGLTGDAISSTAVPWVESLVPLG